MRKTAIAVAVTAILAAGCKDDPGTTQGPPPNEKKPTEKPANVVELKTLVPYGVKIPCAKLLDPVKIGTALGMQVTITDDSAGEKEPTSICGIKLAGEPLTVAEQEKIFNTKDMKIGVQPGDEICQIKAFCSDAYNPDDTKAFCTKRGFTVSTEIGDMTCVQAVQAGDQYRYIVTALDPDTRCRFEVSPVTITEEAPMKKCAQAAVETVGPENLQTN